MSLSFVIGKDTITVFLDGKSTIVDTSHINYTKIREELMKGPDRSEDVIRDFLTVESTLFQYSNGEVRVEGEDVYYGEQPISPYMAKRFVALIQRGRDPAPWIAFMANLVTNPNKDVANDLFRWLEAGHMPMTTDGHFLAFKKIKSNYTDVHTGKYDNSPGNIISEDRASCNPNRNETCSRGLHFCSSGYLNSFSGERIVLLKINPRDVVSIPTDYNNSKGRCCMYEIVREIKNLNVARSPEWNCLVVDLDDGDAPSVILESLEVKPEEKDHVRIKKSGETTVKARKKSPAKKKSAAKKTPPKGTAVVKKEISKKIKAPAKKVSPQTDKPHLDANNNFVVKGEIKHKMAALAKLLETTSITQLSVDLGVPRSTLSGWKKKILG